MLSLVEPQSSGIGGGAFMTYYDARTGKVSILDGREVAPAQATPAMFLHADGTPMPFEEAVLSGRATGVPGVVRMLAVAHDERGKLPWNSLFADAERTAREGFIVSPRLARLVRGDFPENKAPDVVAYFSKTDGTLVQAGDRLRNPDYADFLRRLAGQGPSALYAGSTAGKIIARTRAAPLGGSMTMADLAAYRPVTREALCRPVRVYLMCVPPPPSSGVGLIQLMKLLEHTDIAQRGPNDPQAWYLFAEASRIMYADRDRYVGDVQNVPVAGLLDPTYVASRAQLIGANAGPPPSAGSPPGSQMAAADSTLEPTGTSHFIVGDAEGNVVFRPVDDQGRPAVNAVAPGKRPRSSMTPAILLTPDNRFAGAIGSAGGNAILAYVAKSLVAAIDWNLPMQQALAQPNLVARGPNFQGEITKFSPEILTGLRARGVELKPGQGEDSGVHGVLIRKGQVDGGFDPRREGRVLTLPSLP